MEIKKKIRRPVVCLLVGGHEDDQQLFIQALRDLAPGSVCYIATDADEAIRILQYGKSFPDYIFIDIEGSARNGKELMERIRSMDELKNVPVVIHSAHPTGGETEELHQLGVTDLHIKEVTHGNIREMLDQYIL